MSVKEQNALKAAVEIIKIWHGRAGWDTYFNEAPEMAVIRDAVKGGTKHEKVEKPTDPRFKLFRDWYVEEFAKRNKGEKYPFQGAKDGHAINRLLKTYDLEGSKAKATAAWEYIGTSIRDTEFMRRQANSISTMAAMASRLGEVVNQTLAEPGKWDKQKSSELKLN